jgi:hypothetical protein
VQGRGQRPAGDGGRGRGQLPAGDGRRERRKWEVAALMGEREREMCAWFWCTVQRLGAILEHFFWYSIDVSAVCWWNLIDVLQMVMAVFAYIYYQSFVMVQDLSVEAILEQVIWIHLPVHNSFNLKTNLWLTPYTCNADTKESHLRGAAWSIWTTRQITGGRELMLTEMSCMHQIEKDCVQFFFLVDLVHLHVQPKHHKSRREEWSCWQESTQLYDL